MGWYLYIDDERTPNPRNAGKYHSQFVVARTAGRVKELFDELGPPSFISFDHDLGTDDLNGCDIAHWIVDCDIDGIHSLPENFEFQVHSANPVGAENIRGLLANYLDFKKGNP